MLSRKRTFAYNLPTLKILHRALNRGATQNRGDVVWREKMIRKFLTIALLCFAGMAWATDLTDRHVNETLGFSITKPAGWHWMTAQQNLENLKRAGVGSEEFQKLVVQHASAPLVIMTQHEEPYDGLNASFKANIRAFGSLPTRDPMQLLSMILPTIQQQMTDSRIVVPVEAVEVDGLAAAHVMIEYTLQSPEGGSFPTTSEMWIVPVGDYFFMLGAGYSQGDAEAKEAVYAALQSVDLPAPDA